MDVTRADADVIVHPGTGAEGPDWDGYPPTTTLFVEGLAKERLSVQYATPQSSETLELRSPDLWLPVLQIVGNVGINVVANAITAALGYTLARIKYKYDKVLLPLRVEHDGEVIAKCIEGTREEVVDQLKTLAASIESGSSRT